MMPKRILRFTPAARRDLVHIYRYIADQSGSMATARVFVQKLRTKCSDFARLPAIMGKSRSELGRDIRSFSYKNYVLLFRYSDNRLEIVRIIEGHRDIEAMYDDEPSA